MLEAARQSLQRLTVCLRLKREKPEQQQRTPAPETETALQPFPLHWHGRVCRSAPLCSPLQYTPHDRICHSHTNAPSECVYVCARESERERERDGWGGGDKGMQAPVCVCLHRNVRKSTPHKTHQRRQQQLQLIVLQPGLTVAAQLRERERERGKKGGVYFTCLVGRADPLTHTGREDMGGKRTGAGSRQEQDGL